MSDLLVSKMESLELNLKFKINISQINHSWNHPLSILTYYWMLDLDKEDFDSLFYDCDQQKIMNLCQSKTYFDNNSFTFIITSFDKNNRYIPLNTKILNSYINKKLDHIFRKGLHIAYQERSIQINEINKNRLEKLSITNTFSKLNVNSKKKSICGKKSNNTKKKLITESKKTNDDTVISDKITKALKKLFYLKKSIITFKNWSKSNSLESLNKLYFELRDKLSLYSLNQTQNPLFHKMNIIITFENEIPFPIIHIITLIKIFNLNFNGIKELKTINVEDFSVPELIVPFFNMKNMINFIIVGKKNNIEYLNKIKEQFRNHIIINC